MARFGSPATWGRSKHFKANTADTSTADLNQSYSQNTSNPYGNPPSSSAGSTYGSSVAHHPYATNPGAGAPVVAHDVVENDESCPVCLESLAFSFRLPGEKPHVVPECGHALHEACFTTVYGPLPKPNAAAGGLPRKNNLGVCGVCRRPMKVGDGDGGKSNKLAALTGMGGPEERASPYPSNNLPSVIVGPNRPPGSTIGGNRLPNGQTPMGGNVVVLGGMMYNSPKNGGMAGGQSPSPTYSMSNMGTMSSNAVSALIDAHPSGGSYASAPVTSNSMAKPYDPMEDDPLEHTPSMRSGTSSDPSTSMYVVAPSIQVRSEFPTITPNAGANTPGGSADSRMQALTCIVIVELASRRTGPPQQQQESYYGQTTGGGTPSLANVPLSNGNMTSPSTTMRSPPNRQPEDPYGRQQPHRPPPPPPAGGPPSRQLSPQPSQEELNVGGRSPETRAAQNDLDAHNPAFESIAKDLENRIADWKGHPMSGLGALKMFDILSVRRDALVREFYVYLFREAIICVLEDKKKNPNALNRLLNSDAASVTSGNTSTQKPVLRLKGRIYIRHIKRVLDTSNDSELSLTIDMEDERLESFILIFKDRTTLEGWRSVISALVENLREGTSNSTVTRAKSKERLGTNGLVNNTIRDGRRSPGPPPAPSQQKAALLNEMEEFGGMKPGRVTSSTSSNGTTNFSTADEMEGGMGRMAGHRTTMSSAATTASKAMSNSSYYAKNVITEYGQTNGHHAYAPSQSSLTAHGHYSQHMREMHSPTPTPGPPTPTPIPHTSNAMPSNSLPPLPHTAMDLILVISLPPPNSSQSTAALKLRVIKASLDFIIGSLGVKDRLSLVTFEVGTGGRVRKTPFLRVGRNVGRDRLNRFVDSITFGNLGVVDDDATENGDPDDEFLIRTGKDEKTDVVTGVNHALDTVLQRKAKNPISGMLLVSDSSESARRAQMDLVLARAEAANLPIHSFGYGRSHDPASLWLMSNHTNGTYTFVKDWYDLRSCLAGCIGGMMSIGLNNMKLHMKILDTSRFRIRKVSGGPHAIVSSEGKDVDVEIGEVRYGEKKEMLVELELDHWGVGGRVTSSATLLDGGMGSRHANATDQFVARMGLDALSLSGDQSPNLVDGMMDRMIDEVPVFEVDGSFFDPAVSKHVSRLAHPVLLTVTLLPPPNSSRPTSPNTEKPSDPVIVRRRMELLASDMITRALVLISRKNHEQALKIMSETRRILNTVLQTIGSNLSGVGTGSQMRSRKELLTLSAIRALQAVLQDVQILTDAMDDNPDLFAHDHRNLGAQQAMILRDQKSWSGRTAIERLFWNADSSIDLVQRSNDWVSIRD